jgi:hypothetical protein
MSAVSGIVQKDSNFSNLYVTGQLSVQNGGPVQQDTVITKRPTIINLELDEKNPNTPITLTPSGEGTIIYTLSGDLNTKYVLFEIDDSNSYVGQEMIWLFSNTSQDGGIFMVWLASEKFVSLEALGIPNGYKTAQYWFNTGNGWEFTVENC